MRVGIGTQFLKAFPDAESARVYLEGRIWKAGAKCPTCGTVERVTARKNGFYRCNPCRLDFTIRSGTIFARSHVPLHKWLYVMYLLVTESKGISSLKLSKEIGITQKTTWHMMRRLRTACERDTSLLNSNADVDMAYMEGKNGRKNEKPRARRRSHLLTSIRGTVRSVRT